MSQLVKTKRQGARRTKKRCIQLSRVSIGPFLAP
jgi:hypothetical protein